MEIISTNDAPQAIGPYSQAIAIDKLIFTSGQIPLLPNGDFLLGDIKEQTKQVCENLRAVLIAAGSDLEHVIKTNVYLSDMSLFAEFNEVYGGYFAHKPARSTVAVKELPRGSKVEVECVAIRKN
ncbi:deaminase [Helicobacter saguini]|uniref:Deaminase n=1 Tax=Helicobacter saguini TaxID=1548018 RepID=A0A347VP87_9HELI|nr:RidA family protein [Helicobacter saguini]MWV61468.1 deaminase [Helicobacter saguini]MWV67860.1 deaminase [Helicobacter saguini]MWV70671.1 deaminase [Helicobacter saguini]MWV72575.1 deaminase [Helicobacter saguini]TLD94692.1 RidA family protein [Helicobacter saguini]